ncbi:NOP protein chaperone 1-like [Asterias amurensis]|uniref:NOP protein chaperone 1-like n=1 Tax=Asterias amurensis TaxID=7602 RepID=UPI003AB31D5F
MEPQVQKKFDASKKQNEPKLDQSFSTDLLDVGKAKNDPLLITKKKPYRMPPSSVLSQVKSFLPMMQEANSKLEERLRTTPAEDLDIENIQDCEQEIIEMNLSVFAQDDSSSEDDGSLLDDTSDEDEDNVAFGEVTAANIRLPSQTGTPKRTMIQDLSVDDEVEGHNLGSDVTQERCGGKMMVMPLSDDKQTMKSNGQQRTAMNTPADRSEDKR